MSKITPWMHNVAIVDKDFRPTPEFMRWLGNQLKINQDLGTAVPQARQIITQDGIQGGGDLTADRILSLTNTGVTAGVFGSGSLVPKITVDEKGRITDVENVPVSGGGGGGGNPWYFSPPSAADFPVKGSFSSDLPVITDDTDIGLTGRWQGSLVSGDVSMGFFKNLPVGDWEVKTRFIFFAPSASYIYGGIAVRNTTANRSYTFNQSIFGNTPLYGVLGQKGWAGQAVNATLHSCVIQPYHFRISYNATLNILYVHTSAEGKNWILIGQYLITSFLTTAPDLIGFKLHTAINDATSGHEPYIVVDRWEQSW